MAGPISSSLVPGSPGLYRIVGQVPAGSPVGDEVLAAAPDSDDGRFRVPPMLGEAP